MTITEWWQTKYCLFICAVMERKCGGVLVKEVELGVIIAAEVHSVFYFGLIPSGVATGNQGIAWMVTEFDNLTWFLDTIFRMKERLYLSQQEQLSLKSKLVRGYKWTGECPVYFQYLKRRQSIPLGAVGYIRGKSVWEMWTIETKVCRTGGGWTAGPWWSSPWMGRHA